ncbi:MAG TPA: ferritin-like domain-containing protein [Acidimicrobiales bacterium]|nr:ferritin-like domain-containing protein [Acidimicrobiales bacterium]
MTLDLSRRRLLAAGAAAVVAGACSERDGGGGDVDLDFAAGAAGIERLAVDHFTGTGRLLTDGKLGALVPPALAALVANAVGQHRQAHDAWNKVLAGAGRAEVTASPAKAQEALNAAGLRVTDVLAAAALALRLEDYACQTYQRALPTLGGPETTTLAARLNVAGQQRQAVLRYLLGRNPLAGAGADPHLRLITG